MGSEGPTCPVMTREEVDRALTRLGAEWEAIESSLLSLQDHAGRRLLEGAELAGTTKHRWASAEHTISLLWSQFETYGKALGHARKIRSRRRWPHREELIQLTSLLRGDGLTVGANASARGRLAEQVSLDTLVERMNAGYARVLDVVAAADAVWSALPARIDLLAAELRRVHSLARSVGVLPGEHPAGDELEQITAELVALRREVVTDPLEFWTPASGSNAPGTGQPDSRRYDRAARALEDVRREIDAVLAVRQDADARLSEVRDVLSRADRTLAEARTARVEVLTKIAAFEVPVVSGPVTALQEDVARAAHYRRHAQWHRLSPLLDDLERRAEGELHRARAALSDVTAPLAVRAELRGRLDAYRAKLTQLGLAEEPLLTEPYDVARRMLWSAPCDLRAAEAAVLRFQRAAAEALAANPGREPRAETVGTRQDHRRTAPEERREEDTR